MNASLSGLGGGCKSGRVGWWVQGKGPPRLVSEDTALAAVERSIAAASGIKIHVHADMCRGMCSDMCRDMRIATCSVMCRDMVICVWTRVQTCVQTCVCT